MSLHVGLYTGLSAIRAAQAGIDTASHNIANASTPGYTRQRVELRASIPFDSPDGPIGTGVDVTAIGRLRDQFLDARVRTTGADFARTDTLADLLGRVEDITAEPDRGISVELGALWDAFEDLAIDPQNPAVRQQVLNQLDAVSARVRSVAGAWDQLGTDTALRRDVAVDEINDLLGEIASINRSVANHSGPAPSDHPTVSNDLLDRRDALADRVAELTGARVTRQADGTVGVQLAGQSLVVGSTVQSLSVVGTTVQVGGTDVTASLDGELAALHEFVTDQLPAQRTALDQFVATLVTTVNDQHAAGHTASGAAGGLLLSVTAGDEAATLDRALTSPDDLAVGATLGTAGTPGALDGENAQALADLRTTGVAGGGSLDQRLASLVVDLGAQVAAAGRAAGSAGDLAVSAQVARQSQHGVSLDEEMVDLVRFQRQMEAASRVMTAIDQALDTLVNRVGIVGR